MIKLVIQLTLFQFQVVVLQFYKISYLPAYHQAVLGHNKILCEHFILKETDSHLLL